MPYFGAPNVNGNPFIGPDNALDNDHYINGYMGPNHGIYGGHSDGPLVSPENTSPKSEFADHNFDEDALTQLRTLAQDHPEYMEVYLSLLAERENTISAQKWYEDLSNSSYQRAYKDLEKAGINPYLALQSLGGAGSGSVNPAGTWSTSPYGNKVSMESAKASSKSAQASEKNAEASMIRAVAGVSTAILGLLIMLL